MKVEVEDWRLQKAFAYARERGLPYYNYQLREKYLEFGKIQNSDYENGIVGDEVLQLLHGVGLAWSYFPHHWEAQVAKMKRPIDVFNDDELLMKALASRIKWGGKVEQDGYMTDANLRKAIRTASGVQAVSNFRPVAAASIYHKYGGDGVVWDMSSGYGGRLLGALACKKVNKYIGTDPSTKTFEGLKDIAKDFSYMKKNIDLHNQGSEDFVPQEPVDLCFTSPPYFDTEKYCDELTQSYKKFSTQQEWLNGFFKKTIQNCYECLKDNGFLIINIANVKSYKDLEQDAFTTITEQGFFLHDKIRLRLSSYLGGFKHEPVFIFKKNL